jgi:UDP-MurNAc hydroxylase
MKKQIKLLAHASVLIKVDELSILTDPWFVGTAFNDGWSLLPAPKLDEIENDLKDVKIIWISHEHPDHLNFPTMKLIRDYVSKDVVIIFQKIGTYKVFNALKNIGYENFIELNHMEKIKLDENVEVSVYSHRHLDSALAVFVKKKLWLLNINDCELNKSDTEIIKNKWGSVDLILNQFSIAGSAGLEPQLKIDAADVLVKMVSHHKQLDAKITIPFASFVYFSNQDNSFINAYINKPIQVNNFFDKNNCKLLFIFPQTDSCEWCNDETYPLDYKIKNEQAMHQLESLFNENISSFDNHKLISISHAQVSDSVIERINHLKKRTSPILWKKIKPIIFRVNDWNGEFWILDFQKVTLFRAYDEIDYDMAINSQPLYYAFKMPFGIQTLGVSGRYRFNEKYQSVPTNWRLIRIIASLDNANINLNIKGIFSISLLNWLWIRRMGLIGQVKQQFLRFKSI